MKLTLAGGLAPPVFDSLDNGLTARQVRVANSGRRQPIHVVYGGAHLFRAGIASKLGAIAIRSINEFAPDPATFADAMGAQLEAGTATMVYDRVRAKLEREPVEDYRIDFEDGYGHRSPQEEDADALACAGEVARGLSAGLLPPAIGIRIKAFTRELFDRAVRTSDLFLTALAEHTGGKLPLNFRLTLPKVSTVEQVETFASVLASLERGLGLPPGSLEFEIMIETPGALVDGQGRCALPLLVQAAGGRCSAAHFGAYDYTAACGITAPQQSLSHPACDFARALMQTALAGSGVWLSDGATTIMPVGDRGMVHRAWRLHYAQVRRALENGFYQGWDLHPSQLPARYAAVYAFFLENRQAAAERLVNFISRAARASLVGDVFDDAATGQGLLEYFLRALACGAIEEQEVADLTGLSLGELQSKSFVKILSGRTA